MSRFLALRENWNTRVVTKDNTQEGERRQDTMGHMDSGPKYSRPSTKDCSSNRVNSREKPEYPNEWRSGKLSLSRNNIPSLTKMETYEATIDR